jgi:hypothetical protein
MCKSSCPCGSRLTRARILCESQNRCWVHENMSPDVASVVNVPDKHIMRSLALGLEVTLVFPAKEVGERARISKVHVVVRNSNAICGPQATQETRTSSTRGRLEMDRVVSSLMCSLQRDSKSNVGKKKHTVERSLVEDDRGCSRPNL